MALTRTDRGTVTRNTADASSWAITPPQNFTAGTLAVMILAVDNTGASGADPITGVTDSLGNTWDLIRAGLNDPGAAAAGVALRYYQCRQQAGTITTGTTITVSLNASTTAKVAVFHQVNFAADTFPRIVVNNAATTGSSGTPSMTTASLNIGDLIIGAVGLEGTAAIAGDADTTNGSWSAQQTTVAGTGATGIGITSQGKVTTTAAGTQTYNPTFTTADWVMHAVVYRETAQITGSATVAGQSDQWVTAQKDRQIVLGSDDATEVVSSGAVDLNTVSRAWGNGTDVGLRFQDVELAKGGPIREAYILVEVVKADDFDLDIYAQAADNPGTFTSATGNITGRARTATSVLWQAPNSGTGVKQSVNFKDVVREITDRAGWSLGNALVVLLDARSADNAVVNMYETANAMTPTLVLVEGVVHSASATILGTGSVSATGQRQKTGSATVAATGAISASANQTHSASVTISATSSVTASANQTHSASSTVPSTGSISASALRTATAQAAVAGAGTITATGTLRVVAAATISALGTITADGEISGVVEGAATIPVTSAVTAAGNRVRYGAATIAGATALLATGQRTAVAAAQLSALATITATGRVTLKGAATIAFTTLITAIGSGGDILNVLGPTTSAPDASTIKSAPDPSTIKSSVDPGYASFPDMLAYSSTPDPDPVESTP